MRTVVVGASSGLGRCIGTGLAQRGDRVALLARRKDRLDAAAKEAGPDTVVAACDVTDEESIRSAVDAAASGLGGIDALVYTPGIGPLVRIEDIDAATWRNVFDTNVVGASLVTAAALPHLAESGGAAMYLSSVSASQTPPWPGLGAYAVGKAALDKMIDAWRAEHPDIGFTRLIVGDCAGGEGDARTEFAAGWDGELAGEVMGEWVQRAYISGTVMDVEHLVNMVHATLQHGAGISIPSLTVTPRYVGGRYSEPDSDL
jgi:NAD(P)-dependent dehydrogenase (short-subunit alcohol dehydrogenase family)